MRHRSEAELREKLLSLWAVMRECVDNGCAAEGILPGGLNVKLTPGGIRDIEFLVQCLQRLHGGREAWVRHGGTMLALSRLRDKGLLSGSEFGIQVEV